MSNSTELLVLAFHKENKATEVLKAVQKMIDEGSISVLNMAALVKYKDNRTLIKDAQEVDLGRGALFGAITGGLIGLVGGPVGAVIGAVAGATTGGIAAHAIDRGFPDDYLKELQTQLKPGSSALIVLTKQEWSDRVVETLSKFGDRVLRHVLQEEIAAYLAAVGALDNDATPPAELPAKLEAQITAWQAEIERLTTQVSTNGQTRRQTKSQLVNLRTMQRLGQEKLCELLAAEVQTWTEKIEALQAKVQSAPPANQAELLAQLETTRAQRKMVRERLYVQEEMRLKSWQAEIDELKARIAEVKPIAQEPTWARDASLRQFISTFDEPTLPATEIEANTRITALQARIEAAEISLLTQEAEQIGVWQTAIKDMQAYLNTPGVPDQTQVTARIATVQAQVSAAQAQLKTQLEGQIAAWQAEIGSLQALVAAAEAAGRAKINKQIAALQAQIAALQAQADAATAADRTKANERIVALQAKIVGAQAKLTGLNEFVR
jgi:uncharacterized membrane protein